MTGAPAVATERCELAGALTGELRYSRVWEDHLLLERGLEIGTDDRLLIIGSAGCNVFNLLLREPQSVVAIDFNPAQSALVQLMLAGIRSLHHHGFLELLGAVPGDSLRRYEQVRPALAAVARDWWDSNTSMIEYGISRSGRLDRFIEGFQHEHLMEVHAPEIVDRLFCIADQREREGFVLRELFTPEFERAFLAYFSREELDTRGRHPSQTRYLGELNVGQWFLDRLRWVCTQLPTRGNFYLERFLLSGVRAPRWHPPYLIAGNYERLQSLVGRVTVETGELEAYVASQPHASFTKAALSDVFEYLSEEGSASLFATLADSLCPRGRIAYWNLFVPRESPASLRHKLQPLRKISNELSRRDRAWFYGAFHIEEVLAS